MDIKDFTFQLHTQGSEVADYRPTDRDEPTGGPKYYGFVTASGTRYIIIEETISSNVTSTRYAVGTANYTVAWTNRAILDYFYYYQIRGEL